MDMTKKEEKKSEYQKLIDLLNEYDEIREYAEVDLEDELISLKIISKWYGFIKWLVENEKIHNERIDEVVEDCGLEQGVFFCNCYGVYESLLMLLSIQEKPIEFLVSILK